MQFKNKSNHYAIIKNMKPNKPKPQILLKGLTKFKDGNSISGQEGTLYNGKLTKPQGEGFNTKTSKKVYFVKPAKEDPSDKKAVIISRQMKYTAKNSEKYGDIEIAKQTLKSLLEEKDLKISRAFEELVLQNLLSDRKQLSLEKIVMVSQEVEGLKQGEEGKNYQYQYYLGMVAIAGDSDWRKANIGNNKNGDLAVIDISGPSTVLGKKYTGSFLFWEDFFLSIRKTPKPSDKLNPKLEDCIEKLLIYIPINKPNSKSKKKNKRPQLTRAHFDYFSELLWLSNVIKKDHYSGDSEYFGDTHKEPGNMSYKSVADFINKTREDALYLINLGDNSPELKIIKRELFKKTNFVDDNSKDCSEEVCKTILDHCTEVLSKIKEDDELYKKITAYIDGAIEFFYLAPSATIEEKHILGENPEELKTELIKVQKESFKNFAELIKSFGNENLTSYFEIKKQKEELKLPKLSIYGVLCDGVSQEEDIPEEGAIINSEQKQLKVKTMQEKNDKSLNESKYWTEGIDEECIAIHVPQQNKVKTMQECKSLNLTQKNVRSKDISLTNIFNIYSGKYTTITS